MTSTDPGPVVHAFHTIMDSVVGLPEDDVQRVEDLVRVGEWQVALENLCTQLHEYDIDIEPTTLGIISELGRQLNVPEHYLNLLIP
jgi:hypothetical protein